MRPAKEVVKFIKQTIICFSKNVFSRDRLKPWFVVTFDIILSHIFPGNFIEIPQIVFPFCGFFDISL